MKFILFMLLMVAVTSKVSIYLTNSYTISDLSTLTSNVAYTVTMNLPSLTIPASSFVLLQFSQRFIINSTTVKLCQYLTSGSTYTTIACQTSFNAPNAKYEISLKGIYNTTVINPPLLKFQIYMMNPMLAALENIDINIMNGSNTIVAIAGGTIAVNYVASPLNGCSYISSNDTTGVSSKRTISFTPAVPIISGSALILTLPPWFSDYPSNAAASENSGASFMCTGLTNSDSPTPSCESTMGVDTTTSKTYQQFTVLGLIGSDKILNSAIVFEANGIYNPFSLAPFGPIIFQLKIYDYSSSNFVTSQKCTNIYHNVTKMNTPTYLDFAINTTLQISTAYPSCTLEFDLRQPFPAATGQIKVTYNSSAQLTYPLSSYTISTTPSSITFGNVLSSDQVTLFYPVIIGGLSLVTPPSSRPFTITVNSQWLVGGLPYGINSASLTFACLTGALTAASVLPSTVSVNAVTQYVLQFTTTNNLVSGSFVAIKFPSQVTATVGACTTNNAVVSCAVTNSSYASLSITGPVAGASTIIVTFPSVKNPNQALTISSFQVYTYYDAGLDSMVDKMTSGVTFTSTSNAITVASVTPVSFITYGLTNYTFVATLPDPIPANGYIRINFPSTISFGSVAIFSASFPKASCTLSAVVGNSVSLNACFSANMVTPSITFVLSGIYNPPSLQPTTSFSIYTYGPIGMVDSITTGLTLTMTTPATSANFTVNPLNKVVHTFSQYNIDVLLAVPHLINDYFIMSIPASMAFSTTPACLSISGIGSISSCPLLNTTAIKVNLGAAVASAVNIRLSISTIRNYDIATSQSFQLFFFDSLNNAMETTPITTATYNPMTITSASFNFNDQIALYQSSNLTLTITTPFSMDVSFDAAQTSFTVTAPANFIVSGTTTCSSSIGTCTISGSVFSIASVGLSISNGIINIGKITLPYFSPNSASFSIVYAYGGSQVAKTNSVAVTVFCSSPCERCVAVQTSCASCLPPPNNTAIYLHTFNSSCLNSCPDGYYANDTLCIICNPPCLYCLDSVNCTKCNATTYLMGYACLTSCPATYFGNGSNFCEGCGSPCDNCTDKYVCTSCIINFYANSTCVTAANCPAGTFADIPSKTCAPCAPPCSTCSLTTDNCTSCAGGYVLYQNSCLTQCPGGYYNNSNICFTCSYPCGNCTSSTFCLTCTNNFLSAGSCLSAAQCPAGTFADNTSNTCATCPIGCSTCSSSSVCSGCNSVYVFYNYTCLLTCPSGTYQSTSNNCIPCSGCLTCQLTASNCLSCSPPLLLSGNSCSSTCLTGTFSNGVSCVSCSLNCANCVNTSTTCTACPNGLYLTANTCNSVCPTGTFQDVTTNNCSACSPACASCSTTATTCTGCPSSKVLFQGTCTASCPGNYFNISGTCLTCSNCASCMSITVCAVCIPSYYMLNGVCYSSCPAIAIADVSTMTCTPCNSSCATCSGTPSNCLTCIGGLYLLNSVCFSSCPNGFIASGSDCVKNQLGSIIYFPFSITFLVFLIIVVYSNTYHNKTEMVTVLCGAAALLVWISWVVLVYQATNTDIQLQSGNRSIIFGLGMVGIIFSVALGFTFAIWFRLAFRNDNGFNEWVCHQKSNLNAYRIVFCMTLIAFPSFRIIYSRLFNSQNLCCFFLKGAELLSGSGKFAFLYILTCLFPLLFVSGYVIFIKPTYDQTLISSIDSLLLDIFLIILLIIDTHSKDESFFDQMLEDQPYLKRLKYDQLNHSQSSLRDIYDDVKARHKSQVAARDKQEFFRTKVTIVDNLNKFGHLNAPIPERPGHQRKVKTLPNDLEKLPQFDINQDQIKVIDDDFFFQEEERRRRREEEERLRQEQQQRKRKERELLEEKQRRRRMHQEDMDEQHQVEFPDLAAIEKLERKGENTKKSPTHILNNFKKVDDRNISEKDRKKVEEMAKKNGLDPAFMAETFGVEKNHNPELLNAIIDKHNHVDRQAVKALFSPKADPEVLQELFGKKSSMDPARLRNIMNDPQSSEMISKLVDAEKGILAPDIAKLLLDGNSKYSEQFVKQLLSSEGKTLDPAKLKEMLKQCPDKASRQAALKALKKIGGNNLQNKTLLQNLLGQESILEAANFTRVVSDLSKKAMGNIFLEKSEKNDIIINKLLNNKKIDLKALSPILEDGELVEELGNILGGDNPVLQQNLLNLLKNGEELDPELLKQFLTRPNLLQKLCSQQIDPAFLTTLLKKDAKTDLSLLEKTIESMSEQQIGKVFEFNPQKNVDFQKLGRLFEFNSKTDPQLVAQLLSPEIVENVYSKTSNTRAQMLNKLVEKGKQIDPQAVLKIYGDENKVYRQTGRVGGGQFMMGQGGRRAGEVGGHMTDIDEMGGNGLNDLNRKYNNTDNNFNMQKDDLDDELGFKKGLNQINMSRTDGRMLGFLSPIQVGQHRNKKYKNGLDPIHSRSKMNGIEFDDLQDQEITEYNEGDVGKGEDDDDEYEIIEQGGKRRRRKKIKKKPLDDIRLPSQQIYLQRLEAPHQLKKKNIRKKKKKGSSSMQQLQAMDEDNQVYDLDF